MDIFGDDIDTFLNENNVLNENIHEESNVENDDQRNSEPDDENVPSDVPIEKIEPKKRSIRNPQFRLNVERLQGPRGIHTIEKYFTDIKFRGKGHENEDLNTIMKRLEHWAHRAYPKFTFDDFITTTERLGKKKQLQSHMYRYRRGLLEDLNENQGNNVNDDDEGNGNGIETEPMDELDDLIGQQLEKYRTLPLDTTQTAPTIQQRNETFDSIHSSVITTPKFQNRRPVQSSTPFYSKDLGVENDDDMDFQPLPATPVQQTDVVTEKPKLTAEQMARITENRMKAMARRNELQKQQLEQLSCIVEE